MATHAPPRSRLRPVHLFAGIGVAFALFEAWVWITWLAAGPHAISAPTPAHASATSAWLFQVIGSVVAVAMACYLIRDYRRVGRVTPDIKLAIAAGTAYIFDCFINARRPIFVYSSTWLNLDAQCGHGGAITGGKACGSLPEPVLFIPIVYAFGVLLFAIVITTGMRMVRDRRPAASPLEMVLWAFAIGSIIDLGFELETIHLKLWEYPAYGGPGIGHGMTRFPLSEILIAAFIFAGVGLLRYFRDDSGHTVAERGLATVRPQMRGAMSLLAVVGYVHAVVLMGDVGEWAIGPGHSISSMAQAVIR